MAIREFEKNILTEMDFVEKVTSIREKFIKRESDEIIKCDNKTLRPLRV